jgi:hypothetical protein
VHGPWLRSIPLNRAPFPINRLKLIYRNTGTPCSRRTITKRRAQTRDRNRVMTLGRLLIAYRTAINGIHRSYFVLSVYQRPSIRKIGRRDVWQIQTQSLTEASVQCSPLHQYILSIECYNDRINYLSSLFLKTKKRLQRRSMQWFSYLPARKISAVCSPSGTAHLFVKRSVVSLSRGQ